MILIAQGYDDMKMHDEMWNVLYKLLKHGITNLQNIAYKML